MTQALHRLVEMIGERGETADKHLIISHCNAPERAELVKKLLLATNEFKRVIVLNTRGVNSMYANAGGVIVTA